MAARDRFVPWAEAEPAQTRINDETRIARTRLRTDPWLQHQWRGGNLREVEHVEQAVRLDIAVRQRLQAKAVLDQLQHRTELVRRVRDALLLHVRRQHEHRNARSKPEAVDVGRGHMIVEAAEV